MAHRLAEGQQDLPVQHMEVAGRSGAVDHNPVAFVELAYLEVFGECLEGRRVAERWPTCGTQAVALPSTADAGSTPRVGI